MRINLSEILFQKTALRTASFFFIVALTAMLSGCGDDWTTGNSEFADRFNGRFRFYYGEECRYDSFGPYNCSGVHSISPSMPVSLQIQYDGYAILRLDGETFRYDEFEYSEGYDKDGRYYYQFYETDGSVTVYDDGSEVIYVDTWAGEAFYYYEYLD